MPLQSLHWSDPSSECAILFLKYLIRARSSATPMSVEDGRQSNPTAGGVTPDKFRNRQTINVRSKSVDDTFTEP